MNAQTNSIWAKDLLGYNNDSNYDLANYGCLVTAWGNMLIAATGDQSFNPRWVNNWMKSNNGFTPGGGEFIFSSALGMGHVTAQGWVNSVDKVNTFLAPTPNFAIVECRNKQGGQHFVLANKVGRIIDSADGKEKPLSTYLFVNAHLYTATNMPAQEATPVPIPPASGVLDATTTINVTVLNARAEPNTSSPVMAVAHAGTIHVNGWIRGQQVTVNGRTDNVWLKTDGNHWIAQAGTSQHE